MLAHECQQLWHDGLRRYVTDWWNWMDSSLIFLYLCYYSLQLVVYFKVSYMYTHPPLTEDVSCYDDIIVHVHVGSLSGAFGARGGVSESQRQLQLPRVVVRSGSGVSKLDAVPTGRRLRQHRLPLHSQDARRRHWRHHGLRHRSQPDVRHLLLARKRLEFRPHRAPASRQRAARLQ